MQGSGLFRTMSISSAGLSVQRMRLDTIAENLANVETTRTEEGGPYKRKTVSIRPVREKDAQPVSGGMFSEMLAGRAGTDSFIRSRREPAYRPEGEITTDDNTPFTLKYDPGHPDANANGVVTMPNINVIDEMVDMITATRAYEANVTAIQAAKDMFLKALDI